MEPVALRKPVCDPAWSDPELWAKIRSGDKQAREKLLEGNFGLVQRISTKMHRRLPSHVDVDEIIGFGTLGLMRAVEHYRVETNVYFETYAAQSIRSLILDELRAQDWAPRSLRRRQRAIDEVMQRLMGELEREPTDEEIATALTILPSEVSEVRQATQASHHKSLDEGDPERDWGTKEDDNPSSDRLNDAKYVRSATDRMVDEFRQMPLLDQMVLILKYFAQEPNRNGELETVKLRTVGEKLGITESRASQIHSRAVVRVRDALRASLQESVVRED